MVKLNFKSAIYYSMLKFWQLVGNERKHRELRSRLWNLLLPYSPYASDECDYDDLRLSQLAAEVAYLEA